MIEPSPPRYQIAFQGGGARIATLMAAAEAIQSLEEKNYFKVTRVSGTSAGAIVAAAYAAGVKFSDLDSKRIELALKEIVNRRDYHQLRSSGRIDRLNVFYKGFVGKPLIEMAALKAAVRRLLGPTMQAGPGIDEKKIAELTLPLFITTTKLNSPEAHTFKDQDFLLDSIANSCAFPFVFRGFATLSDNDYIDGGVSENLPSTVLMDDMSFGEVIAVALDEAHDSNLPKSAGAFAMRIMQSSINNSVARAKRRLGQENVCSVPSDLATFDFEGMREQLRGTSKYDNARKIARDWFAARAKLSVQRSIDEIDDGDAESLTKEQIMRAIAKSYNTLRPHRIVKSNYIIVNAQSLAKNLGNGPAYDQITRVTFVMPDPGREISQYPVGVTPIQSVGMEPFSLKVFRQSDGKLLPVNHTKLPMIDTVLLATGKQERGRILLTLHEPIPEGDLLCIVYSYYMDNAFPELRTKGLDYITIRAQAGMEVEEAYIILLLPNEPISVTFRNFDGSKPLDRVGPAELKSEYVKGLLAANDATIWKAVGIAETEFIGIKLLLGD
jgi:predicted acylesterase/phospholipase RssA